MFQVEFLDQVGLAFVQVDRLWMHHPESALAIHLADGPQASLLLDLQQVAVGGDVPERYLAGRVLVRHPEVGAVRTVQLPALFEILQELEQLVDRQPPKILARLERQLEGCRTDVVEQDQQIIGLDQRLFGGAPKEVLRVARQELVERIRCSYQNGQGGLVAAPGAAGLLPGAGDGAGIAGQDSRLELSDVDTEFERSGCHDRIDLAFAQSLLDRTSFERQVAAAVAAYLPGLVAAFGAQVGEHQLDCRARPAEQDGLDVLAEQIARQAHAFHQNAAAYAELFVNQWGIVDDEVLVTVGCAVVVDHHHVVFDQFSRQLARVANGGRGHDELRVAAVVARHPSQTPQHVGDVRSKNTAVGVQFIQDDVTQVGEQICPQGVMGQDTGMQHVGIGQHDVGVLANGGAGIGGRVAVIDPRGNATVRQSAVELFELLQLILRERLGREEVESACLRVSQQ